MATSQQSPAQLQGPAIAPPPGLNSNFVNPENTRAYFMLTVVLAVTISTLALLMRMYTKVRIICKVGWEDYTAILGYLTWIAFVVPMSLIMKTGGGRHGWDVQLKDMNALLYYAYIAEIIYDISVFIIKLSILLQYKNVFVPVGTKNRMYWSIQIIIWLNFAFYFAITFATIFLCTPREKFWNVFITTGHCGDKNAGHIASAGLNSFSDFMILLLPQSVIWKLQMPLKRKLGVSAIFLMGLFVCITSVMRLYYSIHLARTNDDPYNITLLGFWLMAELSVAVICSCLPVLPRFFQTVRDKTSTILGRGSSNYAMVDTDKFRRRSSKQSGDSDVA